MTTASLGNVDLTNLSLPDVLQLMVSGSGKSWEDIGSTCGWSPSNFNRIRDPKDDYWPTLPKVAAFCVACHSTLLIDWLAAQVKIGAVELDFEVMDCAKLIRTMGSLFKEMGDVAKEGEKAISPMGDEGSEISQTEARRLIRELVDVMNRCGKAISGLRPIAGRPGDRW